MDALLKRAQEILDVAERSFGAKELFIVIGALGEIRILDRAGWSMQALRSEFAAAEVYKVERFSDSVRVEASDGSEKCLIQRSLTGPRLQDLPGFQTITYAVIPQIPLLGVAAVNDRSPHVLNS